MEPLSRLSEPISRMDLVTDAIRKAILGGVLAPGEQLVERVLADQLGVSKTPVREALRSLEASGLLESYPSRGVVVRQANAKLVEDLYEYRLLLEPAAVRMAVPHQDPAALKQLQKKLDLGQQLGEEQNLSELSRLNRSFHEGLYEECSNELLKSALDGMGDQLAFVAAAGWRAKSSWETERREHAEILQAVMDGDGDKAGELTYAHIESAWTRLLAAIG